MTQHQAEENAAVGPVETIARRVRELRRRHGWSAAQLAERLRAVGLEWDRNIIANLETGRRANVSVTELLALAYALDVQALHLLVPLDDEQPYQVTPTVTAPALQVRRWIHGGYPLEGIDARIYHTEVPESEWRHLEQTLQDLQALGVAEDDDLAEARRLMLFRKERPDG